MGNNITNFGSDEADEAAQAAGVATMFSGGGNASAMEDEDDVKPPRSGMITGTVVLAGAVGLGLLFWKGGPSSAVASDEVIGAQNTVSTFLASGAQNLQKMQDMLKNAETIVQQFDQYPDRTQVPLEKLQANPFRTLATKAPKAVVDTQQLSVRQQELEKQAALEAVRKLNLQTVMYADADSTCMINNRMLSKGESINQFTVETINPGSVVVRSGAYRFQLTMRQ